MRVIKLALRAVVSAGVVGALLAACSATPPSASSTPRLSPLANTEWTLTSIADRQMPSGTNVTLLFALFQASGFSGCNNFTTSYAVEDTGLRFGPIAGTRKSCGEALDTFESGYLSALGSVTHFAIANDTLTLTKGTGETILTYGRMAPATIDGPWNISQVNNGQGGVSPLPTGVSASVSFMPDGTVQGFGGCNTFGGGYSLGANDKISIGPLMSTMKACGDPTDTAERQILAALQASTKWAVSSGALELRDDGGALQVGATTAIQ